MFGFWTIGWTRKAIKDINLVLGHFLHNLSTFDELVDQFINHGDYLIMKIIIS